MRGSTAVGALLALTLTGCQGLGGGYGGATLPGPGGEARPVPAPAPAPPSEPDTRSPTDTLLEQSRLERMGGRYEASAASLERALRIAPEDPRLWLELAELRLLQDDRPQAAVLAQKALTLASGAPEIVRRARAILAAAES